MVDATENTARVILDDTTALGVLYPGYNLGEAITVPKGEIRYITIYNGNQYGNLNYKLSFSGAQVLALSSTLASAALVFSAHLF
mmetsp:Transcript_15635/g.26406  ORF Transcript_15635/g.26406 Transcript_15635/m.26406 type:complete len:84 (-) Transcript_15635:49-300(-)